MKVSIMTQPLGHNYGGLLQAYSLQVCLRRLGCEVEILNYRMPEIKGWRKTRIILIDLFRLVVGIYKNIPSSKNNDFVLRRLYSFRDNKISLSDPIFFEEELVSYYAGHEFDALVVGSDQVWRPKYSPCISNYYFDFSAELLPAATKISYAASFGVDSWEYSEEQTFRCAKLLKAFNHISVREDSAVALCMEKFGVQPEVMLDPVFLLGEADYDELLKPADDFTASGKLVGYVLDKSKDVNFSVNKIADFLGLEKISIKPENDIHQVSREKINNCEYRSVEEWVKAISTADFVVTDSFHGCALSIIFSTPFLALGNARRGQARFESLLRLFGLEERLVSDVNFITPALIEHEIDWEEVSIRRRKLSNDGVAFLKKALLNQVNDER